jgi:hypothetical protein
MRARQRMSQIAKNRIRLPSMPFLKSTEMAPKALIKRWPMASNYAPPTRAF